MISILAGHVIHGSTPSPGDMEQNSFWVVGVFPNEYISLLGEYSCKRALLISYFLVYFIIFDDFFDYFTQFLEFFERLKLFTIK